MNVLETRALKKYYGEGETQVRALDGVDLTVAEGEFVAIVGTSGSGKSTLLHMLGGLDEPTSGKVLVEGKDIFQLKKDALTIFRRRKIGVVFQSYNLVPVLNVYENIVLPIELDGNRVDRAFVGSSLRWGWKTSCKACPVSFPGVSSSGWPLPVHWPPSPLFCWRMSPPAIWIPRPAKMCSACFE